MGRAPCCDKASVKKGPWSPEEDKQLKEYIEKHGTGGNWIAFPHKAGLKRCGKSCRLRWLNYLRPNIKHGDFSDVEDRIISNLYSSIGSRWSIIASQLPGRTDNDIKNYWNTKLKKKLLGIATPQRKPHQQHQKQQFPSSFETIAPFLSSPGLEGIPVSPYLFNSLTSTASAPVLQGPVHQNCNLIMFGDEQGCSSSDGSRNHITYANDIEQIGFENYLYGGLEEAQKILLGGGGGGEASLMGFNFEDVKPIVSLNNGCNSLYLGDLNSTAREVSLKTPGWSMYFY